MSTVVKSRSYVPILDQLVAAADLARNGSFEDQSNWRKAARVREGAVKSRVQSQRGASITEDKPFVFIVDDDVSVRTSLRNLFRSVGLRVNVFESAKEFLQSELPHVASCLVLDIRLPGISGLEFQTELAQANINIPIIFITAHGDIPMSVRAMKAGAVDFLAKPFREQDMLDAVASAIEYDRKRRGSEKIKSDLRMRFESLTVRERQVMALVTAGLMNKEVAAETGLAEITVKIHRMNVMRKMSANSLADLVKKAEALGVNRTMQ